MIESESLERDKHECFMQFVFSRSHWSTDERPTDVRRSVIRATSAGIGVKTFIQSVSEVRMNKTNKTKNKSSWTRVLVKWTDVSWINGKRVGEQKPRTIKC